MIILQTIAVALSMFSAIPMPHFEWNGKNMRYSLCAFPLVGVICGLVWLGISVIHMPELIRGALFCLSTVIITGGIHLDGYADTCDALASFGDTEKKQEILHDPHTGAFAVIRLCSWFVLYFSVCSVFEPDLRAVICAGLGFILSRTLSGFSVAAFPIAKGTGLAHAFASSADKKRVQIVLLCYAFALAAALIIIGGVTGCSVLIASFTVFMIYRHTAIKQFGGLSGDLAGWFLSKCELWQLAAIVLCQQLGVRI